MNKIKISSIVLIVCLLVTFIFDTLVPVWLGISIGAISIIMLVLLNLEMLKVKGLIKKLVLYTDVTVGLFLVLTFMPINPIVNDYLSHLMVFIFAGLLIAILINSYKVKKKD